MKSFGCKNLNLHEMINFEIFAQEPDEIFRKNENFSKTFFGAYFLFDLDSIFRFGIDTVFDLLSFFKISVVNSIL